MNLSRINDWLLVGQTPENEADLEQLFREGVTAIINCRIEHDDAPLLKSYIQSFDLRYLNDGVPDWTDQVPLGKQPLPVSFFEQAIQFFPLPCSPAETVLSHCTMGFNRSMTLAYFFLRASGMDATHAMLLLMEKRPEGGLWNWGADIEWRKDAEAALKELGYI